MLQTLARKADLFRDGTLQQPKPHYELKELVEGCAAEPPKAFVTKGALETAVKDFNLSTQTAVLGFVGNNGLESPYFINTKPWENNPDPKVAVAVDAWGFFSGTLHGYLAFFFSPITQKWAIKSFKKNDKPDPRNLSLGQQLAQKLPGLLIKGGGK